MTSGYGVQAVPVEEGLSTAFYVVLEALLPKVRDWERQAGSSDAMTPEIMARLWASAQQETSARDSYGRALQLDLLPDDLLAQVDPRSLVADATKLPEDVEPWIPFVRRGVK